MDDDHPILLTPRRALATLAIALAFGPVMTSPVRAAAPPRGCPDQSARIVSVPKMQLSEADHPSSDEVGFAADLGSDGRVRDMQLLRSSGDRALDARLRDALEHAAYRPTRTHCVAVSGAVTTMYRLTEATPGPPGRRDRSSQAPPRRDSHRRSPPPPQPAAHASPMWAAATAPVPC